MTISSDSALNTLCGLRCLLGAEGRDREARDLDFVSELVREQAFEIAALRKDLEKVTQECLLVKFRKFKAVREIELQQAPRCGGEGSQP